MSDAEKSRVAAVRVLAVRIRAQVGFLLEVLAEDAPMHSANQFDWGAAEMICKDCAIPSIRD